MRCNRHCLRRKARDRCTTRQLSCAGGRQSSVVTAPITRRGTTGPGTTGSGSSVVVCKTLTALLRVLPIVLAALLRVLPVPLTPLLPLLPITLSTLLRILPIPLAPL